MPPPQIIIIAGPNGAGKSTSATRLLPDGFVFVNADEIAKELAGTPEENVIRAGRLFHNRLDNLERTGQSFAVETTLANKTLAQRITRLRQSGHRAHLFFVWLPSVELAINRVAERVREGGHNIPERTIRRRYRSGLSNLFTIYQPLVDSWRIYDNSQVSEPRLIVSGDISGEIQVYDSQVWQQIRARAKDE